jgi:Tfp pilus assembly protein PilO
LSAARRTLYPHLDQLARTTNLTTVNYAWAPDQRKTGSLRKITMTLTLEGEYRDVRRFIHELETAPEFLVLESVAVTTDAEGDRQLKLLAHVATYYRTAGDGN